MRGPRFSISGVSTPGLSFEQDLELCIDTGIPGIGIDGTKLLDDRAALADFRASGLSASVCFGPVFAVLPLPLFPRPETVRARVEAIVDGIRRLAPFEPAVCTVTTGPRGAREPEEARALVVDAVREIARAAADVGVRIQVEPHHSSMEADFTILTTLPDAVELVRDVGEPNVGILFDVWHLWDTPDVLANAREHASLIASVHLDDRREPSRGWRDRVLPGEGVANVPALLGALDAGGFDGWFDLEILSDLAYADSLWRWEPRRLAETGRETFMDAWNRRHAGMKGAVPR